MADYHVYIHYVATGGGNSSSSSATKPTKPSKQKVSVGKTGKGKTIPSAPSSSGGTSSSSTRVPSYVPNSNIANTVLDIMENGFSVTNAIGVLKIAYQAFELGNKATGVIAQYSSSRSGDYAFYDEWQNFNTALNNIKNPISAAVNAYMTRLNWTENERKQQEQRELYGDAEILDL